jgi:hypothetical protein
MTGQRRALRKRGRPRKRDEETSPYKEQLRLALRGLTG